MRFLRTTSTRRLLAVIAGALVAIIAGTAIAIGASAGGPKPVKKPLAQAIHSALAAPEVAGITARISFTNNLIDTSEIQNNDPLLTHASGRVWMSANHQFRLELQGENGDAQVVVNQRAFWVYDPQSNTVYRGTLPPPNDMGSQSTTKRDQLPTVAQIQAQLNQARAHINLSGAIPTDVGGRPTYTLRVSPQHAGGLLGRTELAWDAARGVPLRFALYDSRDPSKPVLEIKVTNISYQPVRARVFSVAPPKGAKVVRLATPPAGANTHAKPKPGAQQITGAANVAKHLNFKLAAPGSLDGLPQQSVSLLDWRDTPAALVTYGQNLGGIAVIEHKAEPKSKPPATSANGQDRQGLSLPSVTINGTTAQELDTAIGTAIQFTRGGVTYTVLGSVPPAAAVAAARAL